MGGFRQSDSTLCPKWLGCQAKGAGCECMRRPADRSMSLTPQQEFGHRGQSKPIRYEVTNRITGKTLSFKTSTGASRAMDRIDNEYGAVICTRRAIWRDEA